MPGRRLQLSQYGYRSYSLEGSDRDDAYVERDLSDIIEGDVEVTYVVTELDDKDEPVQKDKEVVPSTKIPVGLTPVFVTQL